MTDGTGDPAAELLCDLANRGFTVTAGDGGLFVRPRSRLSRDDCDAIRRHKQRLLELVAGDKETRYVLHLVPMRDSVPGVVRLRRSLKVLLRMFSMRCVRAEEVPG